MSPSPPVRELLESFLDAMREQDRRRWRGLISSDFIAYDAGLIFRGEELFDFVGAGIEQGRAYSWHVAKLRVVEHGDWALATYLNRASQRAHEAGPRLAWLESALLERDCGRWRLKFFHSTAASPSLADD
jgi:ketosteroid isomerase-like protein